ncbi:MAG: hypothetical protein V4789_31720, partial [Burkholderia gladioli]
KIAVNNCQVVDPTDSNHEFQMNLIDLRLGALDLLGYLRESRRTVASSMLLAWSHPPEAHMPVRMPH